MWRVISDRQSVHLVSQSDPYGEKPYREGVQCNRKSLWSAKHAAQVLKIKLSSWDMLVYSWASHLCFVRRQMLRELRSCGSHAPCRLVPPLRWEVFQQQHLVGNTSQGTQTRTSHWSLPLGPPQTARVRDTDTPLAGPAKSHNLFQEKRQGNKEPPTCRTDMFEGGCSRNA